MRNKIVTFLFLLYFFTFIISPLSYAFEDDRPDPATLWIRPVVDSYTTASKSIKVFLWDLVCSSLVRKSDNSETPSSVSFLMKKKRAVIRSNSPVKQLPVEYGSAEIDVPHESIFETIGTVAYCSNIASYKHFYLVPSGLSPPSFIA